MKLKYVTLAWGLVTGESERGTREIWKGFEGKLG